MSNGSIFKKLQFWLVVTAALAVGGVGGYYIPKLLKSKETCFTCSEGTSYYATNPDTSCPDGYAGDENNPQCCVKKAETLRR